MKCGIHGTKWKVGCRVCQISNKTNKQIKAGTLKIVKAPDTGTQFYQSEVTQIIAALGLPWAMTTDWSSVSDFGFPTERIAKAAETLGVEVRQKDYLLEIAVRLRVHAGRKHDRPKKEGKVLSLPKKKDTDS
jgi:hypothetical protein